MSSCARETFLQAQRIAGIGEAGDNVIVHNARLILQDIGFAPSGGHQADHKYHR
jgi:hypothetical protein